MSMVMKRLTRWSTLFFTTLFISACSSLTTSRANIPSALDPHGTGAARIASLWWVMFALGTATFIMVIGLLVAAILRGRRATNATAPDSSGSDTGRNWPIFGGIFLPLVVIGIV